MTNYPSALRQLRDSRNIRAVLFLGLFFLLLPAGCANFQQSLDSAYRDARTRNYEQALTGIERSALAKSKNNRLLYLMEKGLLLHLAQHYRESNHFLEEADRLVEELFTRSLSAESLSFISSDKLISYAGEDYESAYLNYYKARNYLALGELDGARVEARKLDEKLNHLASGHSRFRESGFLRLLTGLIYEAVGEWNDAYIAYRQSLDNYREYERQHGAAVPEILWGRLLLAARKTGFDEEYRGHLAEVRAAGLTPPRVEEGVIAVLIDYGFVPVKREAFVILPTEQGFPVKLALPEFQSRSPASRHQVEVSAAGEEWLRAERVEDVGTVARQSLEEKKNRVLAKMIARAVAKEMAVRKTEKELGPGAGMLARVAGIVSEQADVRSWTMLPDQVLLAVLPGGAGGKEVVIRQGDRTESYPVLLGDRPVGFVMVRM